MGENDVALCEICGNEVAADAVRCPYCGAPRTADRRRRNVPVYRIINLEKGMPPVQDAVQRLHNEIGMARLQGEQVLILIHGYGSSGWGGKIKDEVRRQMRSLQKKKEIRDFLPGEECDRRSGGYRQLLRRFPFLERVVGKANPGVSVAVL